MRIQLDYYRILGLTPQAKVEQINQAYGDRSKSLPRREYSEKAISARKKLLNVAHTVLADSSQRQLYDAQILPELIQSKDEDTFSIEIDSRDLSGALLILYELGEFDQIINLSNSPEIVNSVDRDLILSTVLAYLELGREYWSQGKYQAAAQNFNHGVVLLDNQALMSEVFPEIYQELQSSILRLRPYQVLELMSSGQTNDGIALLKELLEQRRGIDGKGDDYSGLNIDKFLEFILELRIYMTSSEQEELFEQESRRPSLVASYLTVYALIAKGVNQKQPNLIRRAKSLLNKMNSTQNVYFEEAICSLLLGQLSEATEILLQSNETERIVAIQRLSKPENDLVKGLYNYTQTWLNSEIYPNFKDLIGQSVDLDEYFSDRHVQAYIDELPNTSQIFSSPILSFPDDPFTVSNNLDPTPEIFTKSRSEYVSRDRSQNSSENLSENLGIFADRTNPEKVRPRNRQKVKYKVNPLRLTLFLLSLMSIVSASAVLGYMGWNFFTAPKKIAIAKSEPVLTPIIKASIANIKPLITPNSEETLDQKTATTIVTTWQKTKAEALGNKFKVEGLEQILIEPVLSDWRSRAASLKNTNAYLEYTLKSAEVKEFKAINKDKASILTDISEVRNYFVNGRMDQATSKSDRYQVEYVLTRKNNKWMISAMNVR